MPGEICFAYLYLFKDMRGITRYTVDVCNALSARGRRVSIICPYRRNGFIQGFFDDRVTVHCIPHIRYRRISTIPGFLWFFLTGDFDVVNISLGFGEGYAAVLAKRLRKGFRYNVVLHMAYESSYPLFSKQYARGRRIGLFDHAHRIIAVSDYVARSVGGFIDARKLAVAYNGVNVEWFHFNRVLRQQERKRLGIADDEMVLLTTSALSVQKNIMNIFPALKALIREGVNVRYLIAGHGSKNDLAHMNAGITRFGLDRCVTYLGECLDTLPLYNAADVFVLLSDYEAFGISVIEAASCGLPCITSDAAAFPEIVSSDIGCRVGKDDTQGMIRLLRGLMPEKVRDRFRITARAAVEQRFDVRRNAGIFLE